MFVTLAAASGRASRRMLAAICSRRASSDNERFELLARARPQSEPVNSVSSMIVAAPAAAKTSAFGKW